MIFFGESYTALESQSMGLVNKIVNDWEELQIKSDELAIELAINSNTTKISKHILNEVGEQLVPNSSMIDAFSAAYFAKTEKSDIRKEAFFNKRLNEQLKKEKKEL